MRLIFICLIILSPIVAVPGQVEDSQRLARIPAEYRSKLKEKLRHYIEYYRTKNWGLNRLAEFNPMVKGTFVDKPEFADAGFMLEGCVRFTKGENYRHNLHAYLANGDWCFGAVYPADEFDMTPKIPCKMSDYDTPTNQKN